MEENYPKEINFLQMISIIFQWLKKVFLITFKTSGSILQLAFKYKWTVIIITVLFFIAGQYFARPSARVYKAEAMAMIYGSDAQTLREVCKQLENTLSTNKNLSLAAKISVPDSISKNIVSIKSYDVIDYLKNNTADKINFDNSHSLEDTMNVKMDDRIYIQIKTKNISQVPLFQAALTKYFDENPILKAKHEAGKKNYLDRIQICDIELQRIDSLAKIFYFKENSNQMKFENNQLFVGENRKQLFYDELLRINSIKGDVQSRLAEFIRPVYFPSNFVVNPHPQNGRIKYGVFSLILGFMFSVIFALIFENTKKFIAFLKNK